MDLLTYRQQQAHNFYDQLANASHPLFLDWEEEATPLAQIGGEPALNFETVDDFDLVATIERVYVNGNNPCIAVCNPPPLSGAWIRFYETVWNDNFDALERELNRLNGVTSEEGQGPQ